MKTTISLALLLFSFLCHAQAPQGISFQGVAFSSPGNPVISGNVGVRISILDNSVTGTALYTETWAATTNAQGLFQLNIGLGTAVTGNFSSINWGTNPKFIKVEVDPAGGTNYITTGTNQLMSVPYALYAEKTGSVAGNIQINDDIVGNKYANFFFAGNDGKVYAYSMATSSYVSVTGAVSGQMRDGGGNFAFLNSLDNKVYAFSHKAGVWIAAPQGDDEIVASNGNFAFSKNNTLYVFNKLLNSWQSQAVGGACDMKAGSGGNYIFRIPATGMIYYYDYIKNTWKGQQAVGFYGTMAGDFAVYNPVDGKTYVYDRRLESWIGAPSGSQVMRASDSN